MKTLEKGKDKLNQICAAIRNETIEPAQIEANAIIADANEKAESILNEARQTAAQIKDAALKEIEKERNIFQSSLQHATKQTLEVLRQTIEKKFFNEQLHSLTIKNGAETSIVAKLVEAIVQALSKEGLKANLQAIVPNTIQPRQISEQLSQEALRTLQGGSIDLGDFVAGAQVKIIDKKVTIDLSEKALKDLLASYVIRKDFRKLIFEEG